MKNLFAGLLMMIVIIISGCVAPTQEKSLNIEIRRDDNKSINEEVRITVSKGGKVKTHTTEGQNYTLPITEEFPISIEFDYTDEFYPVSVDIDESYFQEGSSTGELTVVLPIRKTIFSGKVIDSEKRTGVESATVLIMEDDQAYTKTDSEGFYTLESARVLANGSIRLKVTHNLYEELTFPVTEYNFQQKNAVEAVLLKMKSDGTIIINTDEAVPPDGKTAPTPIFE